MAKKSSGGGNLFAELLADEAAILAAHQAALAELAAKRQAALAQLRDNPAPLLDALGAARDKHTQLVGEQSAKIQAIREEYAEKIDASKKMIDSLIKQGNEAGVVLPDDVAAAVGGAEARILAYVTAHPRSSYADVQEGAGVSRATAQKYLGNSKIYKEETDGSKNIYTAK